MKKLLIVSIAALGSFLSAVANAQTYTQNFDGAANGSLVSSISGWQNEVGTTASVDNAHSNSAPNSMIVATSGDGVYYTGLGQLGNYTQRIAFQLGSAANHARIDLRSDGSQNWYEVLPGGTNQVLIKKRTAGVDAALTVTGTSATTPTNGPWYYCDVSISGTSTVTIQARVYPIAATPPAYEMTATDSSSTILTGYPGIRGEVGASVNPIDDFTVNFSPPVLTAGATTAATVTPGNTTLGITWAGATSYAVNGTAPFTYQYQRSTDPLGLSPVWVNVGTATTGVAANTVPPALSDTGLTNGTVYYYRAVITDSAGTPATAYSRIIAGEPLPQTGLLLIGDSWIHTTAPNATGTITGAGDYMKQILLARLAGKSLMFVSTQGVGGTTTNDWRPAGTLLHPAETAAPPSNYPYAMVCLGINDSNVAIGNFSASQYQTQLQAITDDLVSAGYKVLLQAPPYILSQGTSHLDVGVSRLLGYQTSIASIVSSEAATSPGKVFNADPNGYLYQYIVDNYAALGNDYVHPMGAGDPVPGAIAVATRWADSVCSVLFPSTSAATASISSITGTGASRVITWKADPAATAYYVTRFTGATPVAGSTYNVIAVLSAGTLTYTDTTRPTGTTVRYTVIAAH